MEDPEFTVSLTGSGGAGMEAVKAVRSLTGLSLWRSKDALANAPVPLIELVPLETATRAAEVLRQAGAQAAVVCTWCVRTLPADGSPVDPGPCESRYWPTAHCRANSLTSCDSEWCATYGTDLLTRPAPTE
ncbi:hypothetical protein GCM10010441_69970 [Kitasatospora paracochleata]|uniref:Large ribosomal subunit protein bL12 C-terminal domain-containing protein n=1 Tax=Kitasatospora paracochleata TaxID=58354 RepID=A0ABT1JAU9_9ACTN|nr:hypothetical protein [Kitasatospora paracochleata]